MEAATVTGYTPFELARFASVHEPDTDHSAGAEFLLSVADDVTERYAERDEFEDLTDIAFEVADGAVPIYTYELWAVFVDLALWEDDGDALSEYGWDHHAELPNGQSGLGAGATLLAFAAAERLAFVLLDELSDGEVSA